MADADEVELSGVLHIYVHHARNIHNICIYDDQEVYAKFSLTCNPDEALSTRTVSGAGRNPEFNESLQIKVVHLDAVLKCEIWMRSRITNYLGDQLLGFALIPLSSVFGKGKLTRDFTISSTDLFYPPAGFVQLTLFFENSKPFLRLNGPADSTEVALCDQKDQYINHCEYEKFEFPDVKITAENQKMVFEYFDMAKKNYASVLDLNTNGLVTMPFLQIGASSQAVDEYGMAAKVSAIEKENGSGSPTGILDSKKEHNKIDDHAAKEAPVSSITIESIFTNSLENINLGSHQTVVEQQIVDMYVKSMQQFTESLAKMKLPMDLDRLGPEGGGEVAQRQSSLGRETG